MRAAIEKVRSELGREYPVLINGQRDVCRETLSGGQGRDQTLTHGGQTSVGAAYPQCSCAILENGPNAVGSNAIALAF